MVKLILSLLQQYIPRQGIGDKLGRFPGSVRQQQLGDGAIAQHDGDIERRKSVVVDDESHAQVVVSRFLGQNHPHAIDVLRLHRLKQIRGESFRLVASAVGQTSDEAGGETCEDVIKVKSANEQTPSDA